MDALVGPKHPCFAIGNSFLGIVLVPCLSRITSTAISWPHRFRASFSLMEKPRRDLSLC